MNVERWGWYSVLVNVVLARLHAVIATASGSLAVKAELVHNIVDLLMAAAVLAGLRIATRSSTAFPYGLYKVENLVAAGLAIMIFVSAWGIVHRALLAPPAPVRADAWMFALLLITAAIPIGFSRFELRAGQAANSPALIADAKEYRVHIFTTGLALMALLSQRLHFPVDRIAALLIVIAVVRIGWDLLKDAMRVLLDASLDPGTLDAIREVINGDPTVVEVKWITGHNAGRFRFVEVGIALRVVEPNRTEVVVQRIETAVRAALPHVERILLHVEASATPRIRYAIPLADPAGTLSLHFGEAPWFALVSARRADGEIEESRILANPHVAEERAKGIRVAEWLAGQKVDVVLAREDLNGRGPAYVLHDAGIELRRVDCEFMSEQLAQLRATGCPTTPTGQGPASARC